jgi:hypothetical protein
LETVDSAISKPSLSSSPWMRGAPQSRIFPAHLPNEFAQFATDLGASRPPARPPTPVCSKPCSMPAQDRVRRNDARQTEQVWPEPCHPDQKRAICYPQPKPPRLAQRDIELMAQIQVLDLKPAPRLEPVDDKSNEQVKQGKHRDRGCADSISHCQAHADGIFGRDSR